MKKPVKAVVPIIINTSNMASVDDIALSMIPGLGVRGAVHLLRTFGSSMKIFKASLSELTEQAQLRLDIAKKIIARDSHRAAEREWEYCRRNNITAIASTDIEYPSLLLETDYVLGLWLKTPPPYAATLCVYVLLFNLVANLSTVVVSAVHATGHIKRSSLINGSLYLLVVPFSYFGFKRGMAAEWAYIFNVVAVCGGLTQNAFVVAKFVPGFSVVRYFLHTLFPMLACSLAAYVAALAVSSSMEPSFVRLCATFALSGVLLSALFYLFLFDSGEQKFIREKIKTTYNKSMNVRILHRRMK